MKTRPGSLVTLQPFKYYVIDEFLSVEQCDQLIQLGKDRLAPSTGFNSEKGISEMTEWRKSEGTFFQLGETDLIGAIEKKIKKFTKIPIENGEGLQLLHYRPGGYYKQHHDYFDPRYDGNLREIRNRGGQRVATFMIYLNDVEEGGETFFPMANLKITPKNGRALYWKNVYRGLPNEATLHSAEPVVAGEKWVVTKWLREKRFV